ncbi:MAG: hypothetical protein R6V50_03930 [Thermoplasmatota archaeon]
MQKISNSLILESVLQAIHTVTTRKTSSKIADAAIHTTLETLKDSYEFLKNIQITSQAIQSETLNISISEEIEQLEPTTIGKAIESIIRFIYTDLEEQVGLYFITEFKRYMPRKVLLMIENYNVDLVQLQIEQNHYFQQLERKRIESEEAKKGISPKKASINTLGYTWNNVSSWKHEPDSNYCVLYDEKGNVLDRLNLDTIIQSYVEKLSGYSGKETTEYADEIKIYEQEYQLLELMYSRDMDAETAAKTLHISKQELNAIIYKLSEIEMLKYISDDVVEITDTGLKYLHKKEKNNN